MARTSTTVALGGRTTDISASTTSQIVAVDSRYLEVFGMLFKVLFNLFICKLPRIPDESDV